MHEDKPLVAPSLLELSACVVARDEGRCLYFKEQKCKPTHSDSTYSPSSNFGELQLSKPTSASLNSEPAKSPIALPVACAEGAFDALCAQVRLAYPEPPNSEEAIAVSGAEETAAAKKTILALQPFATTTHLPLSNVDLSGLKMDDRTFAELLIAQHQTLISLNLSGLKGVTSAGVCSLLSHSKIQFKRLKSMKLTSTDLLRVPKFRRGALPYARPHASAGARSATLEGAEGGGVAIDNDAVLIGNMILDAMHSRLPALPVVCEDDLSGTLSSGAGGRGGATVMYRKPGGSSSTDTSMDSLSTYGEMLPQHFMEFCPAVEHLYLLQGLNYSIEDETKEAFLNRIVELSARELRTLDLSEWQNFTVFRMLSMLKNLTTLVLYEVQYLETTIDAIKCIKTLVSLDLSQSERSTGRYNRPVTALHTLATNLLQLRHLEISGTNLIAACSDGDRPFKGTGTIVSDIAGLSHLKRPLQYLGIFNCDNAPHYQNIPAEKICGDHGEDQIILALKTFMERPKMMQAVLNESYQLYRFSSNLTRHVEALHLVLRALVLHKGHSSLQIAGSASLFYIIRNVRMNRDTKRHVVSALVSGMDKHIDEQVMVRNCCLSLCQFEIPQEIMFNYGRVANLLVRVLRTHHSDALTQRIVVFLLNSMACHVEGDQKIQVGNIGAIEVILEQIRQKHTNTICDDVMEVGWSFLWNITDETPANCDRFLNAKGLELFQLCYSQFPNETELVRNMMGLIGNIAEVEHLRHQLMDASYITIFVTLLSHLADGIEISYNSAGVLAHLVSDGEELWAQRVNIPRVDVMREIVKATNTWDLHAKRYINYRSFKPILKLLPMHDSSGSQHWAVWALANLTSTDMHKYCRYVQEEGGEELLLQLVGDLRTPPRVRELANLVLTNISKWRVTVELRESMENAGDAGENVLNNDNNDDMEMVD